MRINILLFYIVYLISAMYMCISANTVSLLYGNVTQETKTIGFRTGPSLFVNGMFQYTIEIANCLIYLLIYNVLCVCCIQYFY